MRKRVFLYFIILIITGISFAGLFVMQYARNLYKNEVRERLISIACLLDNDLLHMAENGSHIDYNAIAHEYASVLSSVDESGNYQHPGYGVPPGDFDASSTFKPRITIIDDRGYVLGESQADYSRMENHLDRKEIQMALKNKIGEDTRFSSTLKMNFLYIAVPSSQPGIIIRVSVPLYQLKKIDMRIFLYSALGMAAGLLLTAMLAWKFSYDISRPVKELTHAAKEIASGNYKKRVLLRRHDEIGQLAATFNEMALKMSKTVADLTDRNIKFDAVLNSMTNPIIAVDYRMRIILMNSVAEKFFKINAEDALGKNFMEVIRNHKLNELLQQTLSTGMPAETELTMLSPESGIYSIYANPIKPSAGEDGIRVEHPNPGAIISLHDITSIRKLEQIRSEFVSNVTHELKTPLTSIKGFVETLRNGAVDNREIALKFLEIIDIEAERLTMLINDILQLSEIESASNDTNIGSHNLTEIISEVVAVLQASADKKGVTLNVKAAPEIMIMANRDRIKQLLINLIDNAIKYNVQDGSVNINAARIEGKIVIVVEDTGIGIERQHHSRIFERFYRVDKSRSRSMGGTGLGLSIVKHIVNLYDGDISLESEPGKGTKFTVQLPV